jgi:hypothetical protein
MDFSKPS